ncbi:SH3 domain-containing protein [Acidaminococcus timonensis]|uniref:SH3 domain-containing protein n=1 Tax=Acidaminococcus timonensis TaxID=1871002 RepID=UPI00307DC0E8
MLKKTCAVLMSCLVLGITTAPVWAADLEVPVKTVTSTQNKVTVECPQVVGGSKSADEKINRALSSQVASFASEASTLGGGKVHYDVHKADGDVISFTIVMTPNMGVEESQGMTFDRKSGQLRPLSYYYTDDQLHVLAENGLKYLYDVDPSRLQTLPDTYYIDKDGSLIGLYHAGAVLDKSEGEIEVNLSAAGVDEDGNVVETPIAHPSDASATAVKQENHEEEVPAETGRGKGLANLQKRAAARQKAAEEKARKEAEKQAAKEQAAKDEEQLDDDSQAKADISRLAAKYRAAKAADAKLDAQIAADQKAQLAQEAAAKKAAAEKAKRDAREKAEAEKARARAAELRKEAAAAAKTAVEAKKETKPEAKAETKVETKVETQARPMTVKEKVAMIQAEEARKEAEEEAARMKQLVAIREAAEKRAAEEKARQEAAARAAAEERARQEEARRQAEAEAEAARQAASAVDYDTSGSGVITGTEVRMRSGAGTDYNVIGAFDNGENVQVLGSAQADGATWYKVQRSDGSTGWVSADYCSLGSSSTGTISGTDVRMRASYSTDSDVLGYFDNGESVTILDDVTSNGQRWLKVQRSDGSVGWVAADFVAEG